MIASKNFGNEEVLETPDTALTTEQVGADGAFQLRLRTICSDLYEFDTQEVVTENISKILQCLGKLWPRPPFAWTAAMSPSAISQAPYPSGRFDLASRPDPPFQSGCLPDFGRDFLVETLHLAIFLPLDHRLASLS